MNISRIAAFGALALMTACAKQGATVDAAANAPKPVATVNGVPLSHDLFEFFSKTVAGKPSAELNADQRKQILDMLVRAEVVSQEAARTGLDKQGEAPSQLALSRLQVLEQAEMASYLKDRKATDAEIKAEYDSQVAAMPKTQYHAHHILVKTKDEADKIIASLKKGAKFETLASAQSIDTGSKAGGGDLSWFSPANMVKSFGDAVVALKKGEVTQTPVQTEFGWHVIRLDDTRETAPPPFDTVKDRLSQIVQNKKFKTFGDDLLKNAKVELTP